MKLTTSRRRPLPPIYWRIVPFDLVRLVCDPRHEGQAVAVHGHSVTVRWDGRTWLEYVREDKLERITR